MHREAALKRPPEPPHADWSGNYGCFATDPGRYRCSRATVGMMALQAYGIKMYQFPTYSAYATTEYAVDARVPEGATAEQVRLMLRSLLAERFKLAAHFEKKEGSSGESVGSLRVSALGLSEETVKLAAGGVEGALLVFPAVVDQRAAILMDHVADELFRGVLS